MGKTLDFIFNLDVFMSNGFGGQFSKAAQTISGLNEKIQKLNKTSGDITGFQKQTQKLETLRQKLTAAQAKVKDFQTRKRQGEIIDPKAFTRANEEAARLQGLVQENERALGRYRRELQGAGVDTSKLGSEQERLGAKIQEVQKAQARFAEVRNKLTWGNVKADLAKDYMYLKMFQQPIQVTMNFDQAMAQVRAVKAMTEEEFSKLETQAMELGASTQFSATQAANTQENLARAGMSISDIMAAMPAVLSMAGAEGMDLAQAGAIIAKGLGGMNLEGKYAGRLADILSYASANSNTNIAMLGEGFKVAAPVFASQGATMEQLASYLAVLANKGYEGSEAGNAIAAVPLRLAKQNKETRDTLAKLGVAVMTREGRLREISDVMIALDQAMKTRKYGEAQQLDVIETIFGKNYGKAMMAFMQAAASGDTTTMYNGVQNNSFGSASAMNRTRNNTLKGDITSLSSAWEGLMIRIGKPLDPINRFFTQTLTTALQKATAFMNEHEGFFDLVIESCYALGGIKIATTVLKYFSLGIEFLSSWRAVKIAEKGAELATAGANAGALAANMGSAGNAAGLFGMKLHTALGWIGLIAFASYEIYQHWDDITEAAKRAGEAISNIDTNKITQAKTGTLSRSDPDYGIAVMESTYMIPSLKRPEEHAFGGILTRPHLGLVAEAGPEAIIPLRNKSRGVEVLTQAAQILGVPMQEKSGYQLPPIMNFPVSSNAITQGNLFTQSNLLTQGNILTQGRELINNVNNSDSRTNNGDVSVGARAMNFSPTYNINVSGNESESRSVGENIRAVIEDTMNELLSRMERVSYA